MTNFAGRRRAVRQERSDWLRLGQAATYLGVEQSTIRKCADQGRVPAFYTPGGHRRDRLTDHDAFLEHSGPGGPEPRGSRVLVVDDDERLRQYVRMSLEFEGYTVHDVGSAEEGLAAIDEDAPDLILLDVMMPQVDGWQMLQRIQERHGSIPVIMFSGKVDQRSADEAASRGAHGFIGKPFDPQQLIERTKQLLPT